MNFGQGMNLIWILKVWIGLKPKLKIKRNLIWTRQHWDYSGPVAQLAWLQLAGSGCEARPVGGAWEWWSGRDRTRSGRAALGSACGRARARARWGANGARGRPAVGCGCGIQRVRGGTCASATAIGEGGVPEADGWGRAGAGCGRWVTRVRLAALAR
jgi:hypothetical protein